MSRLVLSSCSASTPPKPWLTGDGPMTSTHPSSEVGRRRISPGSMELSVTREYDRYIGDRPDDGDHPSAFRNLAIDAALITAVSRSLGLPDADRGLCDWQLRRVGRYIDENISASLPVRELAAIARLSPQHFSRAFAKRVGTTPHAYVTRHRVELARHLLATTSRTLLDIAMLCGFADQAHFCRLFRRTTGATPGAWRTAVARTSVAA
jgi:AraC family transcriptional regulator